MDNWNLGKSSLGYIGDFVWDSVGVSVRDSIGSSIWDSVIEDIDNE